MIGIDDSYSGQMKEFFNWKKIREISDLKIHMPNLEEKEQRVLYSKSILEKIINLN